LWCHLCNSFAIEPFIVQASDQRNYSFEAKMGVENIFHSNQPAVEGAVVVVDPWSSGMKLCELVLERGLGLILLWEENQIRTNDVDALAVILHNGDADQGDMKALQDLKDFETRLRIPILAIIPGSETGVVLAERMAFKFGTPTNPPKNALARRNKFLMGETIKAAGLRGVNQTIAFEWAEVESFLTSYEPNPFKIVVKPNMGAGSDDVFLCESPAMVREAFRKIEGNTNSLGIVNKGVLIQEFLVGKEYAIDTMSRNGKHNIIQIWEYDKRHANGQFNVYFGQKPLPNAGAIETTLSKYVLSALDALEIENGPGHMEVIFTKSGPCMVEIGCRCHGGNASWYDVARAFSGYDQLNAIIDAFVQEEVFFQKVDSVHKEKKYGRVVDLVAYERKEIKDIPGIEFVKSLKSFHRINLFKGVGDTLDVTIDCNTTPGEVILLHEDEYQVARDFEAIHSFLKTDFFRGTSPKDDAVDIENESKVDDHIFLASSPAIPLCSCK